MRQVTKPRPAPVLCAAVAAFWAAAAPCTAGVPPAPAAETSVQGQRTAQAGDVVGEARVLARAGRRAEAVALLRTRLATNPGDLDARTLLGTVLLWEGRYDDARAELTRVLAVEPDYTDALGAMAYLELWTGHDAEAEAFSARVLGRTPNDTSIMLARARALDNLGRAKDAIQVLDALLAIDPDDGPAAQMRGQVAATLRHWKAAYQYGYDWFRPSRDPWHEHGVSLSREGRRGSAGVTVWHADRFDLQDQQVEVDLYPTLRKGTYFYVNLGVSTRKRLYPEYRWGVDWYQSLGHGIEASIGYHYLGFGDGVDIYIGSLSKWLGNWVLISQVFVVPDALGRTGSFHAAVRRHFGDKEYVGLRYKRGVSWDDARDVTDIQVRDSQGVQGEFVKQFGGRTEFSLRGSWERRERRIGDTVQHFSTSGRLGVRF